MKDIEFIVDGWAEKGILVAEIKDNDGNILEVVRVLRPAFTNKPDEYYLVTEKMKHIHWLDLD